jgi:fructose-1-phosphate kinase PfkB-like protein
LPAASSTIGAALTGSAAGVFFFTSFKITFYFLCQGLYGNAFAAGLLYGLHEGWEIARALALAHFAAAASMRAISTTAGVTAWRGCLALGERCGFRAAPE